MGDITSVEELSGFQSEAANNSRLLERTERWVEERTLSFQETLRNPKLAYKVQKERNARQQIYREIERDVQTGGLQVPSAELVSKMVAGFPETAIYVKYQDSLTGEPIYQILRKEDGFMIAEERTKLDWSVSYLHPVSQAKLNLHGGTELTLKYSWDRYNNKGANPNIIHSISFPNATLKVFSILFNSVINSPNKENVGFEVFKRAQKGKWSELLRGVGGSYENVSSRVLVHEFLRMWAGTASGGDYKEKMVGLIKNNSEAAETAKEIQDFSQRCLREEHKESVVLLTSPKIKLFRVATPERYPEKGQLLIDAVKIKPWDSFTSDRGLLFRKPGEQPWKAGTILEIDVPIENIFTYYDAHPAFGVHPGEEEYILNDKCIDGAFVISVNGRTPTMEEATKLKENMPIVEVVIDEKSIA
ncbi:hypothetical protein ACFL1Q_01330 [Patescibacteria group bacterium]